MLKQNSFRMLCSVAFLCGAFVSSETMSEEVDVRIDADFVKDPLASTAFGITATSSPVQFSFSFDDANVTYLPAGEAIGWETQAFSTDAYLLSSGSLTAFSFNLGNQSFTSSDLQYQNLGIAGAYSILLTGSLSNLTSAKFDLNSGIGLLQFGSLGCLAGTCQVTSTGYGEDDIEYGTGNFSNIRYSSSAVVTAPEIDTGSAVAELTLLLGMIAVLRGNPARGMAA